MLIGVRKEVRENTFKVFVVEVQASAVRKDDNGGYAVSESDGLVKVSFEVRGAKNAQARLDKIVAHHKATVLDDSEAIAALLKAEGKPAKKSKEPKAEPVKVKEEEPEESPDLKLLGLGFTGAQISRMKADTKDRIIRENIKNEGVSIGPRGNLIFIGKEEKPEPKPETKPEPEPARDAVQDLFDILKDPATPDHRKLAAREKLKLLGQDPDKGPSKKPAKKPKASKKQAEATEEQPQDKEESEAQPKDGGMQEQHEALPEEREAKPEGEQKPDKIPAVPMFRLFASKKKWGEGRRYDIGVCFSESEADRLVTKWKDAGFKIEVKASQSRRADTTPNTCEEPGDPILCQMPDCRWVGEHLGPHIYAAHGLTLEEYKAATGYSGPVMVNRALSSLERAHNAVRRSGIIRCGQVVVSVEGDEHATLYRVERAEENAYELSVVCSNKGNAGENVTMTKKELVENTKPLGRWSPKVIAER